MTDNEIMKALECHIKRRCWDDCPNANEERQSLNKPCSQMIAEDALTLINRQKETIEQLQTALFKCGEEMVSTRAEAVKEFAEKLKEDVAKRQCGGYTFFCVGYGFIDNLVKEFTEGGDGEK